MTINYGKSDQDVMNNHLQQPGGMLYNIPRKS